MIVFSLLARAFLFLPVVATASAAELTALSSDDRQSIELACIIAKGEGPAAYHTCLNTQFARLGSDRAPDLAELSSEDRQSIELACIIAKGEGPAAYHACLSSQLGSLRSAKTGPQSFGSAQSSSGIAPVPHPPTDGREIVASGSWDKGCYVEARSNGRVFRMLLDTGATGMLTFGLNHAKDLGLESSNLNFDQSYSSANGEGRYARVRLREFQLGTFRLRGVEADITQAPQSVPLLGVELLQRLQLRLKDGNCILTIPRA